jgi:hypothetical protein
MGLMHLVASCQLSPTSRTEIVSTLMLSMERSACQYMLGDDLQRRQMKLKAAQRPAAECRDQNSPEQGVT